jgi:alpha-galactosidase
MKLYKLNFFIHLIVVILFIQPLHLFAQKINSISTKNYTIAIKGNLGDFKLQSVIKQVEPGLELVTIKLNANKLSLPPQLTFSWEHPLHNVAGLWSPEKEWNKELIWRYDFTSRLANYAPVITYFSTENDNVQTFAVSDAINSIKMSANVNESNGNASCSVSLFTEPHPMLTNYEFIIRLDLRKIPYYQSLKEVSNWWAAMPEYAPDLPPIATKQPMYSTWYSFHSQVTPEKILEQCKLSKELGCKTVLVDDGWQAQGTKIGYTFSGDWNPGLIPNPSLLSKQIHDLDMKVMYWYAVPFIGEKSDNYEHFKGKYLYKSDWKWADVWILDPRFPEVRAFLIDKYSKAINEWGLDGLKLDFIDMFIPKATIVMEQTEGRDFASINLATDKLMTDIKTALKKIRPDVMIEFRQVYTGPAMRKYGNMFRAHDCANSFTENRILTLDLRLIAGETAVHSDMITWSYSEPVESAAFQLLNVMFSVPQISVRLQEIPVPHQKMLNFWMSFWNTHSKTLLGSNIQPLYPDKSYPIVYSSNEKECVVGLYQSRFIVDIPTMNSKKDIYIINATATEKLTISNPNATTRMNLKIFDCQGNIITDKPTELKKGLTEFKVPSSGLLQLLN